MLKGDHEEQNLFNVVLGDLYVKIHVPVTWTITIDLYNSICLFDSPVCKSIIVMYMLV